MIDEWRTLRKLGEQLGLDKPAIDEYLLAFSDVYVDKTRERTFEDEGEYIDFINDRVLSDQRVRDSFRKQGLETVIISEISEVAVNLEVLTEGGGKKEIKVPRVKSERSQPIFEIDPSDVEEKVVKLANEGFGPSEIGVKLRDEGVEGVPVPDVKLATGKKVTDILSEYDAKPDLPEDLRNLMERAVRLREHLDKHPQDKQNKQALQNTESKVRRLADYYKGEEINEGFTYSYENALDLLEEQTVKKQSDQSKMTFSGLEPIKSPANIDSFEVRINLFQSENTEWYGKAFEDILLDIRNEVDTSRLSFAIYDDAYNNLDNRDVLLTSPVWIIHEECIVDEETYEQLRAYLANLPIPMKTQVILCAEQEEHRKQLRERVEQICSHSIMVTSRAELTTALVSYFSTINPARGAAGKQTLYDWQQSVINLTKG